MRFFQEDIFKNVNYIKNTKVIMNNIIEKLKEFNFSMQQMMIMHNLKNNNDNNLKKRFYIIALGNKSIIEELNKILLKKIKYYVEFLRKLKK